MRLAPRPWIPAVSRDRISAVTAEVFGPDSDPVSVSSAIEDLANANDAYYSARALNLNPASNVMNPRAEALLSAGMGPRTSLGYPGAKIETGLHHLESIEVITAELAGRVFDADFAEVRVPSGAMANLYAFMATCGPGDTIIASPATIGGHVTHHREGAAGLYGLTTVDAPVDPNRYSVDLDALAELAREVRPRLITLGGSLNLFAHPVAQVRQIADEVGATVLFDAAHVSGMIAGRVWPNPLADGAHLMTMSTYKSLGGPVHGLVLTNEAALAERIEEIAFPGMTANFDVGAVAALGVTLADWEACGADYARTMRQTSMLLAEELAARGIEPYRCADGFTDSHQFALLAAPFGGGSVMADRLERANLLAYGIGLPADPVPGDTNGLRIGTPEVVRRGLTTADMPQLADFIARALQPEARQDKIALAREVAAWRSRFTGVHYTAG
ncbi:serine hydroxymethyltransferase [Brevibacterium daeguense]|uniref:Serine hydroxymethyltransferase n=1 Tax=Brevibacterium daeguense TaxID=909936 RepID=A0ABP8EK81_9MICO|nr:beta-eliminating lyase-related protein [Brevibacterium daeguense]